MRSSLLRMRYRQQWLILLPGVILITLILCLSYLWVRPAVIGHLLEVKKIALKDLVTSVWSISEQYHKKVEAGIISEQQAKDILIAHINGLRYGPELKDYVWLHNLDEQIVVHPFSNMKDMARFKDLDGKLVVPSMNEIVRESGSGFVEYYWQLKDNPNIHEKKISYVMLFEPWGWVIGSGFYEKETYASLDKLTRQFNQWVAFAIAIISIIIIFKMRMLMRTYSKSVRQEEEIAIREQRFQDMMGCVEMGVCILKDDELVFHNQSADEILKDVIVNPNDHDATIESKLKYLLHFVHYRAKRLLDESNDFVESWYNKADGNRCFLSTHAIYNSQVNEYYLHIYDNTQAELQKLEIRRLSKIIEVCPLSVVITDTGGIIEYVNPYASKVSGYSMEELLGEKTNIFRSDRMPKYIFQDMWKTIKSGGVWKGELLNVIKNGELVWEYTIISPLFDAAGKIHRYFALKTDISDIKQLEKDLSVAKIKAEESDRIKTSFLENVSHEFRTPLNAISGFVDLMDEADDEEERLEYREHIKDSINNITGLVDDMLEISQLNAGDIQVDYDYWNLNELIEEVVGEVLPGVDTEKLKKVEVIMDFDSGLEDPTVVTDRNRFMSVMMELLKNAFKYTEEGSVRLGYEIVNQDLRLFVADTGVGITEEEAPYIFDLFYHGNSHYFTLHNGTGVGLNLVSRVTKLMGGSIEWSSAAGEGTRFNIMGICESQDRNLGMSDGPQKSANRSNWAI